MMTPAPALAFGPQGAPAAPPAPAPSGMPGGLNAVVTVVCWINPVSKLREWTGPASWDGPMYASYVYRFLYKGIEIISVERDPGDPDEIADRLVDFKIYEDEKKPTAGKSIRAFCGLGTNEVSVSAIPSYAATGSGATTGTGQSKRARTSKPRTSLQTGTDS
ncbi:MAG: hypothetical protein OEY28_04965, partial [Nitrospira sp.]|nr:hypothetical protein [Nitrospira sp.]